MGTDGLNSEAISHLADEYIQRLYKADLTAEEQPKAAEILEDAIYRLRNGYTALIQSLQILQRDAT